MRLQVLPEGAAKDLRVGGLASAHCTQQTTPRVGHAIAETVEIQAEAKSRWMVVSEHVGRCIEREPTWSRFLEDPLADEMPQHPVQGIGIVGCIERETT